MNRLDQLDILHNLMGSYIDLELENFILSTKLLEQGVTLENTKAFTKAPKLIHLFREAGQWTVPLQHHPSFKLSFYGQNSIEQVRSNQIFFLHDDLWEVTVLAPEELASTHHFSGQYLVGTLRQGLNGIIPQIVKKMTNQIFKDSKFLTEPFTLKAKLNTTHASFATTTRGQLLSLINFNQSEAEVFNLISPEKLFGRLIAPFQHKAITPKSLSLFQERLKLWDRTLKFKPGMTFKDLDNLAKTLPPIDFGIKEIGTLKSIVSEFSTPISNSVLLTGEVGNNLAKTRETVYFNKNLKKLLK